MNQATVIGRLGAVPKIIQTKDGLIIGSMSIATTDRFKSNGQQKEKTTWHNIRGYANMAKMFDSLKKGDLVFIHGKIFSEQYEKDGVKKTSSGIVAQMIYKMTILAQYNEDSSLQQSTDSHPSSSQNAAVVEDEDDIPY
jgi:single-strand DNA-binding protein